MKERIITGLLLGGVLLTMVTLGGWWFAAYVTIGSGIALWEYYMMLRYKKINPMLMLGIVMGCSFILASYAMKKGEIVGMMVVICVLVVLLIQFFQIVTNNSRLASTDLASTIFGSIYIGGLMSFLPLLVHMGDVRFPESTFQARMVIMLPVFAAYGSDVGAYFFGSFFGKTKLFPALSPKKTLEGCLGGVAVATAFICGTALIVHIPLLHAIPLGIIASIFGQIGDLSESALKREVGVKDSSRVFGSHGGFLDRIDSILFTIPVIYYYFIWVDPWKLF